MFPSHPLAMPGSASGSSIGEASRTDDEEAFAAEATMTQALDEMTGREDTGGGAAEPAAQEARTPQDDGPLGAATIPAPLSGRVLDTLKSRARRFEAMPATPSPPP